MNTDGVEILYLRVASKVSWELLLSHEENAPALSNFRKQVRGFMKFFSLSFVWSFFQWLYSGGENCGFVNFPTFGLKSWKQTCVGNNFFASLCLNIHKVFNQR